VFTFGSDPSKGHSAGAPHTRDSAPPLAPASALLISIVHLLVRQAAAEAQELNKGCEATEDGKGKTA
jgi:hypothetical protein